MSGFVDCCGVETAANRVALNIALKFAFSLQFSCPDMSDAKTCPASMRAINEHLVLESDCRPTTFATPQITQQWSHGHKSPLKKSISLCQPRRHFSLTVRQVPESDLSVFSTRQDPQWPKTTFFPERPNQLLVKPT